MNKAILMGRLTRDPELKQTRNGIDFCNFTVACDRRTKDDRGEWKNEADFINCVAWRQLGIHVNRYFSKGERILVCGRIQTRSWEDKGEKRYATEVIADEVEFCESPQSKGNSRDSRRDSKQDDFLPDDDTSLPFDF